MNAIKVFAVALVVWAIPASTTMAQTNDPVCPEGFYYCQPYCCVIK